MTTDNYAVGVPDCARTSALAAAAQAGKAQGPRRAIVQQFLMLVRVPGEAERAVSILWPAAGTEMHRSPRRGGRSDAPPEPQQLPSHLTVSASAKLTGELSVQPWQTPAPLLFLFPRPVTPSGCDAQQALSSFRR